jgi:hypothetical protein
MAPHCDTMDGPVVKASEMALEMENVNYVLPYISPEDEVELRDAFERTLVVRELSGDAAELADYWFFETAVRLHRKGEGKPYKGLKSSGLDWGPIFSRAERAIKTENLNELMNFLMDFIREDIKIRFDDVLSKKDYDVNQVEDARDYVDSMLEFVLFTHHLYKYVEKG